MVPSTYNTNMECALVDFLFSNNLFQYNHILNGNALIKMLREKEKLRRKFKKYRNPRDQIEYEILRIRFNSLSNTCYREYKHKIEQAVRTNSKSFFQYINRKRDNNVSLPATMHLDGISAENGLDIANLFASQFSSVYSAEYIDPEFTSLAHHHVLGGNISFTEKEIKWSLSARVEKKLITQLIEQRRNGGSTRRRVRTEVAARCAREHMRSLQLKPR
ncbi:hypothetical protein ACJJTC_000369 [Scirpophaga incertulas]